MADPLASISMFDPSRVTVSAAEMEDPELLAELAAVLGEDAPPARNQPAANSEAKRKSLMAQIAAKKKEALAKKSAGDKGGALALMRESKQLEAQLAQLGAQGPPAAAPRAAASARAAPASQMGLEQGLALASSGMPTDLRAVRVTDADMEDPELLAELAAVTGMAINEPAATAPPPNAAERRAALEREVQTAKREALEAKKSGNKVRASFTCARRPPDRTPSMLLLTSRPRDLDHQALAIQRLREAKEAETALAAMGGASSVAAAATPAAPPPPPPQPPPPPHAAESDDEMAALMQSMSDPPAAARPRAGVPAAATAAPLTPRSVEEERDLAALVSSMCRVARGRTHVAASTLR